MRLFDDIKEKVSKAPLAGPVNAVKAIFLVGMLAAAADGILGWIFVTSAVGFVGTTIAEPYVAPSPSENKAPDGQSLLPR